MPKLEPTRFEERGPYYVAGLKEHYTNETMDNIPRLWDGFGPYIGKLPGQIGQATYGVCFNNDARGFDYLAGVEVSSQSGLPKEFHYLRISAHNYAVFSHREPVSTIRKTIEGIDKEWLPNSGYKPAGAPAFFERYENFDPKTGKGDIEIWLPVEKSAEKK